MKIYWSTLIFSAAASAGNVNSLSLNVSLIETESCEFFKNSTILGFAGSIGFFLMQTKYLINYFSA